MRKTKWMVLIISLVLCAGLFSACGKKDPEKEGVTITEYTVTYYDGTAVLKTEKVEEYATVTEYKPTKTGFDFMGWFTTPSFSRDFDSAQLITEDLKLYAGFTKYQADVREFFILGNGDTPVLFESAWGNVANDKHKMTKIESDKANEYTYTIDLFEGDLFQFAINTKWDNQKGVGYLKAPSANGDVKFFEGSTGFGESGTKKKNITCQIGGNYTFTLKTYPAHNYYDTKDAAYTEAKKEAFNYNDFDNITWKRNSDVTIPKPEKVHTFYLKMKAGAAENVQWTDRYEKQFEMQRVGATSVHNLTIVLKADEEFLFTSLAKSGGTSSTGAKYIRSNNLDTTDATTADLFTASASAGIVAKAGGTYTFKYDEEAQKLTATFAEAITEYDYYIKGVFGEDANWKQEYMDKYKFTKTADPDIYEYATITFVAGNEFTLQIAKLGATEAGEWGTDGYNNVGNYGFKSLVANDAFKLKGGSNMEVVTAGTYKITLNIYKGEIVLTPVV